MAIFVVTSRRGTKQVDSDLSLHAAIGVISEVDNGFAQDLAAQYRASFGGGRPLSANQVAWVHVLAVDELSRRAERAKASEASSDAKIELAGIIKLFKKAEESLRFPKVRLALPSPANDGSVVELKLSVAGARARFPGSINVVDDASKGFLGRILTDGRWAPSGMKQPTGLLELLERFADDPVEVAREYGRLLSRCCFCGIRLSDPRSLAVLYGEICARHYGLPWGLDKYGVDDLAREVEASSR